jgi:hypothetical protein
MIVHRSPLQGSGLSIPNFKPQIEFGAITECTFGAIGNSTGLQKSAKGTPYFSSFKPNTGGFLEIFQIE